MIRRGKFYAQYDPRHSLIAPYFKPALWRWVELDYWSDEQLGLVWVKYKGHYHICHIDDLLIPEEQFKAWAVMQKFDKYYKIVPKR